MRIIASTILAIAAATALAQDYSTATVIEARSGTEIQAGIFGGTVENANVSVITIEFSGMRYTGEYQTVLSGGRNAASNFVVGSEVQARIHRDRQIRILREDGKEIRARITRRELVTDE